MGDNEVPPGGSLFSPACIQPSRPLPRLGTAAGPTHENRPARPSPPDDGVLPMNPHPLLQELGAEKDVGVFRLLRGVLSTEAAQAVCQELSRLASQTGR